MTGKKSAGTPLLILGAIAYVLSGLAIWKFERDDSVSERHIAVSERHTAV